MIVDIVAEIIPGKNIRWVYSEKENCFVEKIYNHIFMKDKTFSGVYGWIDGYGSPPGKHVDVLMLTENKVKLGNVIKGKLIGVFIRCDGDHKLICIDVNRKEEDIAQLPDIEKTMLFNIYEGKYEGDVWLGKEEAISVLFISRKGV